MKKLILPILLLLSFSFASAQSFSLSKNSATHQIQANSTTLDDTLVVTNLSPNTLTLQWEKVVVSSPGGWSVWVCDDVVCHPPSKEMDSWDISGNGHSDWSLHINPGTMNGPAEIRAIFTDVNNPSDMDSVVFTIDAVLNVDDDMLDPLKLYPNPVREALFLDWEDQNFDHMSLEIVNAAGQTLKTMELTAGNRFETIPVSELPKGMYFARVTADGGMFVKKFIKR